MREPTRAVYVISVAAELAGVHPQTLRIYERKGLLEPARSAGGNRRYSDFDIDRLRRIAELSEEGMNLAGIRRVLELEYENAMLRARLVETEAAAVQAIAEVQRSHRRDLVPLKQSVVLYGEAARLFSDRR
jgi:MerR family transcriptional regulator, heat shock protein HspR